MDESFTTADLSHGERSELAWEPPSLSRLQDLLPQYKFLRLISRGGMGAVYQAVQLTLDRPVAIKILPPGIEHGEMNFAQRFKNEARLMAKLSQAGIISVFDFGQTADDHLYLVMEYVEGHTLHDMIRCDGKLSEDVAISYTQQLCEALQYAHDHGIIHRDIKPANILVNANGRLKIADFGLARPTAAYEQEVLLGTPDYVAPEIIESPTTVDHRADIYALGVVIYEMLAGDVPEKPRRPITDRAQIDTAWEDIIRRSTCDMPEHRYQKVSEIQAVVAKIAMRHRGDAVTPLPRKAADRRKKGNHMGLITVLASVVVLAAGGYWFWKTHGATGTDVIAESGSDHDDFPPRVITPPPAPAPVVVETKAPPAPAPTSAPTVAQAPEPQEPYHLPDMAPGHVFQIQEAHRDPINAVVLFADGYRVATASWDGTIKIWNLNKAEKGAVIRTLGPVEGKVTALGVSPDGKWVAGGDSNYTARVWDVQSGELKRQSTQRGRKITGLAFSSNGSQLAVASAEEGASLQLWNWQETDKGELLEVWSHIVNGLIPGPKSAGNTFITASGGLDRLFGRVSSEVIVGSFDTKAWVQALPPFSQIPTLVAMSGDGKAVAFTQKSAVQVVEVSTGKSLGHIGMPQAPVSLAVLDGGRLILSGQPDKTLRIWESTTGKEVYQAAASTYCTSSLAVSADQTYAVTGGGFSGGPELQKDGDYSPHVWALPKLSTLVSDEGRMILVLRNLDQLEKIDPELFKLRQAQIAEWDQKVAHADVRAAYQELDDKYVQALQRYVPSAAAVPREAYLAEISRVANQDPAPSASLTSWPAELKRLFDIYIQQCDLIKQKVDKEKETLGQSEHDKVAKLIAQREKQSDADGVMRAKAVLQELDERIHPAPPPPPVVSAPTVPSAVPPGGSGPATLPGEFKIVVPPLNPKSGLELQRPIVQGRVIAWPRSASGNSPEALGQVPADIGRAVSIGVGEKHALALHPDGTVVSWGHADARLQPPPVELDHVVAVAAGQIVSAFLREDGSVVAWNERNQIVIPPDTKPAVAIYTSMSSVFLRHKDGTLTYLSSNAFTMPNGVGPQPAPAPPAPTPPGTPTPTPTQPGKPGPPGPRPSIFSVPDDLNGVVADLNSVPDGAVALMADGTVRVWGRTNGSKNRRSSVISTIPLEKLTGGIAIGISTDLGWFLKQTGELIVWGPNVPSEFSRSLAFPGGVKLFRAYPANGVAIQSNTGSWRFLSSPNSPMAIDTLSAERFARGCTVVGIGATHVIGLKVE